MAVTNLPCNVFNFYKTMRHVLSIGFQSSVILLHISRISTGCLCKQEFSSNNNLLYLIKCIHGNGPQYLSELLCRRTCPGLRSANSYKLYIPRTQSKAERSMADRAFLISGLKLCNKLPASIQNSCTVDVLKSRLETFLFKNFFSL